MMRANAEGAQLLVMFDTRTWPPLSPQRLPLIRMLFIQDI